MSVDRTDGLALADLMKVLEGSIAAGDVLARVRGLASDSRRVRAGDLFFAVRGARADGAAFLAEAHARGAAAAVIDGPGPGPEGLTLVRVPDVRLAKARAAVRWYGDPSSRVPVVGITGTNGKTTTAWMIRSIAEYDGGPTALLGTIAYSVAGRELPAPNTTPDPIELNALLAEAVRERARLVAMEVSSHALEQGRVAGVQFRAGVLTNVTPEHLDYHVTMEAYRRAKARLFQTLDATAAAVLNVDDPAAAEMAAATRARVVTYGVDRPADVTARVRRADQDGMSFTVRSPWGSVDVATRLVGRFNLANALAAAATALALGYPLESLRGGFELLKCVPGRLEPIDCGQDFRVLVDYAHTDDALKNVLANVRPLTRGKVIVVFGCGGDRDRTKRPRMGRVASELADEVVVTSDNPRGEDPGAIIEEILAGVPAGRRPLIEPDRRAAIERAIRSARGGDIVLICGKGHETSQVQGGVHTAFDDRTVAREVLWSL